MRRAPPRLVVALLLSGCGGSKSPPGTIDLHAPVQADVALALQATPEQVWATLADVARWPDWQPDIRSASIDGRMAPGARLRWSIRGGSIAARVVLAEPGARLAWTGHLLLFGMPVFRAVHVWTLTSHPDGGVLVRTTESIGGWPIGWLYSSDDLAEGDRRWLQALRSHVEATWTPPDAASTRG